MEINLAVDQMSVFIQEFILVGCALGLILLIQKLFSVNYSFPRNQLLILIYLLVTVEILYGWLFYSRIIYEVPHITRFNTVLVLLVGPVFYFTIRSLKNPDFQWQRKHIVHFILFFVAITYFIPFFFKSADFKIQYIHDLYNETLTDSVIWGGIRRFQQLIYLSMALIIIVKGQYWMSNLNKKIAIGFFTFFLLMYTISMVRFIVQAEFLFAIIDTFSLTLFILGITYLSLSKHEFWEVKKGVKDFDIAKVNTLKKLILKAMDEEELYIDKNLTLNLFAFHIQQSPHAISKIVNEVFKKSFKEFINEYRVRKVIELLQQSQYDHLTLEAISELAGFSSSSTFNYWFKRITNKTPRSYRLLPN